ncbi:uncharacterized protein Z519_04707 [Cladophialophora bantiana CBS 173.52]|uniref:Major facilitator superfamily (MFS) profile domain-containing protein n=1 Tax=Cladophialophora bantiana (strain ATCC 10958 / CBS 173.52 / CDC B-1940 / NIH 8579) TaxID=1442370 RepID=A0A0D2HV30_CLAB1|nr:uncharacterized protein Z519_04707 [Cladophialophora bantiana CBS 173.52]KIW94730.1 hypothetical protein Z519_04707 [Cladophialophora bantiana CBS 173.52]
MSTELKDFPVPAGKASDEKATLKTEVNELDEKEGITLPPSPGYAISDENKYSTKYLTTVMVGIWLVTFATGFEIQVLTPLLLYVYSNFRAHSLIPTAIIVSSIVGVVSRLPLAKIMDIWGHDVGFALALVSFTIAASVFLWMDYDMLSYVMFVVIADHFPLSTHSVMFGLYQTPWFITTWIGAPAATAYLEGAGWKWAFGTFAIICPITGIPLFGLLNWNRRSIGLLLIAAGFSLFLLPFSLYTRQAKGWSSPMIICMVIFGGVLMGLFVLWEKYLAPKSLIPFSLLKNPTIIGASFSYAETYLVYTTWYSYFSSSLQVVQGLSVKGRAIGSTISASIWTSTFLKSLAKNLPSSVQSSAMTIYSSIYAQLSYKPSSSERTAIALNYNQAMQNLFITTTAMTSIGIISTIIWRDGKVDAKKQAAVYPI